MVVPTWVAVTGGVVVVPTCVAVEDGGVWQWLVVVVVPTRVAVDGGGGGAHVCGSDRRCGGAHVCGSRRRWWWCPRVW